MIRAPHRIRAGAIAAYGAAALAFAYAAVSLYWTVGGTALLATVGGGVEDVARRGGLPAIALGLAATFLKVAGGMLGLALVRPWGRAMPRRWLFRGAGIVSVALICYGALQVTAGALVLSGALHPASTVDHAALRWHAAFWDLWFLVWGLLLAVATVASTSADPRQQKHKSRGQGSKPRKKGSRDEQSDHTNVDVPRRLHSRA